MWPVSYGFPRVGSPFLVKIGGEPSGRITERITRQREAADVTHIGSQCELSLKIPGQCHTKQHTFGKVFSLSYLSINIVLLTGSFWNVVHLFLDNIASKSILWSQYNAETVFSINSMYTV